MHVDAAKLKPAQRDLEQPPERTNRVAAGCGHQREREYAGRLVGHGGVHPLPPLALRSRIARYASSIDLAKSSVAS